MTKPFGGSVNQDVRDSVPDWTPYEQPRAAAGAPNVVYIVLDDVGFAGFGCYGGMIETPNIDKIAARGVRYNEWHTTALFADPVLPAYRSQPHHERDGMYHRGRSRLSERQRTRPTRMRNRGRGPRRAWIQHSRSRQVAPDRRG